MNISLQKTLHQLTGHSNIADAGIDELFQLTDSHPYFAVPQFFLTQKLKDEKHQAYIPQLQKTALYFSNPYWLHYQLMNSNAAMEVLHKPVYQQEETKPFLEHVIQEEIQQSINNTAATIEPEIAETVPVFDEPVFEKTESIDEPIANASSTINSEEKIIDEEVAEISNVTVPDAVADIVVEQAEPTYTEPETTTQEFTPSVTSFALQSNEIIEENTPTEEEDRTSIDETDQSADSIPDEKIASLLKEQLEEFKKPVSEETVLQIESEPFHTVDYFASQGIQPEYNHADQDVLSKQLRRFTDWLKHMKNVPPSNEDLGTDPELESAIQGIAQTSNEAKEIVTETMAEVLVKQGKIDKAIQLYIKLSFLNPDKSAYFASKIQSLKGI